MPTEELWDVAVIGAGIIGNCAAFHAVKSGLKTIQLEQFSFGHHHGSSHGQSRIIRYAHSNAAWIPVVKDTYAQIEELEKKRGTELWIKCGLLWAGSEPYVKKLYNTVTNAGCELDLLTHEQIASRFPFYSYDENWQAVFDPMGGALLADKWMEAFHAEYLEHGGNFVKNCEVLSIDHDNHCILKTSQGVIKAKKVIVAAGTWVNKLVPQLNVKSKNLSLSVPYWKLREGADPTIIHPSKMPVFIVDDQYDGGRGYFALPPIDYQGAIKFSEHGGDVFESGDEPSEHDSIFVERPRKHIAAHFPALDSEKPFKVDHCKYTMAPDATYIVDYLGDNKDIVLCAMMSGTGFKVAPALGRALVLMAQGEPVPFDLSIFKASRFADPFKKTA